MTAEYDNFRMNVVAAVAKHLDDSEELLYEYSKMEGVKNDELIGRIEKYHNEQRIFLSQFLGIIKHENTNTR